MVSLVDLDAGKAPLFIDHKNERYVIIEWGLPLSAPFDAYSLNALTITYQFTARTKAGLTGRFVWDSTLGWIKLTEEYLIEWARYHGETYYPDKAVQVHDTQVKNGKPAIDGNIASLKVPIVIQLGAKYPLDRLHGYVSWYMGHVLCLLTKWQHLDTAFKLTLLYTPKTIAWICNQHLIRSRDGCYIFGVLYQYALFNRKKDALAKIPLLITADPDIALVIEKLKEADTCAKQILKTTPLVLVNRMILEEEEKVDNITVRISNAFIPAALITPSALPNLNLFCGNVLHHLCVKYPTWDITKALMRADDGQFSYESLPREFLHGWIDAFSTYANKAKPAIKQSGSIHKDNIVQFTSFIKAAYLIGETTVSSLIF